jgi:hypothetical protein
MKNTAERIESIRSVPEYAEPALEYGVVASMEEGAYAVLTGTGCRQAVPAVSCLVRPEKDDVVLLSMDEEGNAFILSVLTRKGERSDSCTLEFQGQVNLRVKDGGFSVSADEDLCLVSGERLALVSPQIEVDALEGNVRIEKMSYAGKLLSAQIEKIKAIADAVDSVFRRAVARFTTSYRYVEEHEEVQSGSTRMLVDGTLTMQTKTTMHTAEGHIKIDAKQIHLG